jgi:hypothetical protein
MSVYRQEFAYGFQAKNLVNIEPLKKVMDRTVREIQSLIGKEADVQVSIESEVKNKKLFSVSMSVFGLRQPIVVKRTGKQVLSVIKEVRKVALRQIHKFGERRLTRRHNKRRQRAEMPA